MARKKRHEDHVNHEAWAIPYGDLITLLLAFFVVMYAISSVNEGKFRVLSESMIHAFQGVKMVPDPIQLGQDAERNIEPAREIPRAIVAMELSEEGHRGETMDGLERAIESLIHSQWDVDGLREVAAGMAQIADEIEESLGILIDEDMIQVRRDFFWLEVEINTSILFDSGSSVIYPGARPILEQLAEILRRFQVRVHVEGFTDNLPINTPVFPSNWELSAGRASSVVRLLAENGLNPSRMAAIGFGEHRPIADNNTAAGRQDNRRVAIVVLADQPPRAMEASTSGISTDEIYRDTDRMIRPPTP